MLRRNLVILTSCLLVIAGIAMLIWPKYKLELGLRTTKEVFDLGAGKPGGKLESSARIWNMSLSPVRIDEIRACCGSTAGFHNGKKSMTLPPFGSALVDVSILVSPQTEKQIKSIEIDISKGKEKSFTWLMFQYSSADKSTPNRT